MALIRRNQRGLQERSGLERIWGWPERASTRKALVTLVAGALCYLVAIGAIVGSSPPALDIRPGDLARRDYFSRVEFEMVDAERTELLRDLREKEAISVYDSDAGGLKAFRANLMDLLTALARGEEPAELTAEWGLAKSDAAALRLGLRGAAPSDVSEAVDAMMKLIAERGVIQAEQLAVETQEGRNRILVRRDRSTAPESLSLDRLIIAGAWQDVRAKAVEDAFARYGTEFRDILARAVAARLVPTTTKNARPTQQARQRARQAQPPVSRKFRQGEAILRVGKLATPVVFSVLQEENRQYWAGQSTAWQWSRICGAAAFLAVVLGVWWPFLGRRRKSAPSLSEVVAFGSLALVFVAGARLLHGAALVYLLPVSAAGIVLCTAFSAQVAITLVLLLCILIGVSLGFDFRITMVLLSGGAFAVWGATNIRSRARLMRLGLEIGIVQAVAVWAIWLLSPSHEFTGSLEMSAVRDSAMAALQGVAVGLIMSGALPLAERTLNVTTDISLLELSQQYQPLLRRLLLEAPGTYHHSFVVATLAEGAAQAVGANGILARVGAYYHDMGKLYKPDYFVENELSAGPHVLGKHTQLSPGISALIIIRHVKEGVRMAEAYGMPKAIVDLIREHHGTSLVEYFYREAVSRNAQDGLTDEGAFRYPGPKPRTKEAAIVSLADALEAASRTMSEPTPARVAGLIDEIVSKRLEDGQLAECDLTLRELHEAKKSFGKTLLGIYHGRIKYPELAPEAERQEKRNFVTTVRNQSNSRLNGAGGQGRDQ